MPNGADYTPAQEELDAVLAFLPIFEQEGYTATRPSASGWPIDKDEVVQFVQTLSRTRMVFPFDWPAWKEARQLYDDPDLLAQADLLTLRKLFTTHIRTDRFNEGHLAHVIENGHIAAMLHRLQVLRDVQAAG
ncbi:MAG TPA: DUF6508 domain-containing protein [Rhodothermales bacterium]|nr:DUF6508 domain-containing protein [Rhodothermales bacterium]